MPSVVEQPQQNCSRDTVVLGGFSAVCLQGLPESPRVATYQRQLNQLLSLLKAQPHSLASFDTALAVQVLIEAVLAQRQISDF